MIALVFRKGVSYTLEITNEAACVPAGQDELCVNKLERTARVRTPGHEMTNSQDMR